MYKPNDTGSEENTLIGCFTRVVSAQRLSVDAPYHKIPKHRESNDILRVQPLRDEYSWKGQNASSRPAPEPYSKVSLTHSGRRPNYQAGVAIWTHVKP